MFVSGWWITIIFIVLLNNLNMLKRMTQHSEYYDTDDAIDQPSILGSNRSNKYSKDYELRAVSSANHNQMRPCHIAVENKADYHYEVIESTIMQYPLPWEKFNCSKQHTIVDVALSEIPGRFSMNERESWQNYFETHLAGTQRPRTIGDGAVMYFGSIQKYSNIHVSMMPTLVLVVTRILLQYN